MALSGARNKDSTEKTEVKRIKRNGPERVAAGEVKAKNMNLSSTLYENMSYPIIDMNIATLMGGIIVITKFVSRCVC